jgi:queuine tRNA-ribosyltransferase
MFEFKIIAKDHHTQARTGVLKTGHGKIKTPVFMPVGTLATVKSLTPEELLEIGADIILGNTYHLYLRPGCDVIHQFSGLHRFMHWHKPILTDSGGFQVFSLAKLNQKDENGVTFQSHIDGSTHRFSPEIAMEIQLCLDADIIMCLDDCIQYPADHEEARKAMDHTTKWARRCKQFWEQKSFRDIALFGIVQGGMYKDLRRRSVSELIDIGFPGYAVGGISVGEPKDMLLEIADFTLGELPVSSPRYVMGVGMPEDLVEMVSMGADMFDCVLPTRNARNGQLFTSQGTLNISNARFKTDPDPVEPGCGCYTCTHYSRAYLRHLYMSRELLSYRLNSIHNIYYFVNLMKQMRNAISSNDFESFRNNFYSKRFS